MRACVLRQHAPIDTQPLSLDDVPAPQPRAGEVLIKVRACGVCRTDLHVIEGELDPRQNKLPIIPGHQIVGEIIHFASGAACAFASNQRVGVAWLHCTCGACRFCTTERENLCERAEYTGWTRNGGYAEYVSAPADFIYPLPEAMTDEQVAPLLCAGIIGYRCLRMTGLDELVTRTSKRAGTSSCRSLSAWNGARLGIYGFGAAGHIAIQIARHRGAEVYVCTRDRQRHQKLAEELGATWVGDTFDQPPRGIKLDAAIIFAPAGEIIPAALKALDRGGRLVLGGIHMSPIPTINYDDLYWERRIVSVANNTRIDGREFLEEAARAGVKTHVQSFPLKAANEALLALKSDAIKGAAVLKVSDED